MLRKCHKMFLKILVKIMSGLPQNGTIAVYFIYMRHQLKDSLPLKYILLLYILIHTAYILIHIALYQNLFMLCYVLQSWWKKKRQETSLVILRMCHLYKERLLSRDFNWISILLGHATEERMDSRMHDKH